MRFTALEILMFFALGALVSFFVIPRVIEASPEVRATQAEALGLKLDAITQQWINMGGVHGPGETKGVSKNLILTQNLMKCFTSPINTPFSSIAADAVSSGPFNSVYENPTLHPNPSSCRLTGLEKAPLSVDEKSSAIIFADEYSVVFDGSHWRVRAR